MGKTTIHKEHILLALLLSAVLIGSVLIKPVHILLVHHDLTGILYNTSGEKILSTQHHECAICDFEFCSFIPQKQVIVPQVNIFILKELASRAVACFVCKSSHNFQLRAPPVS